MSGLELLAVVGLAGLGWSFISKRGNVRPEGDLEAVPQLKEDPENRMPTINSRSHSRPDANPWLKDNYPYTDVNYGDPRSQFEEAFYYNDRTPDDGPADVRNSTNQEGLLPWFGRSAPTPTMIDPLDAMGFWPPKHEVSQEQMHGPPLPNYSAEAGMRGILAPLGQRAQETSKSNASAGSMDYYTIGGVDGYANGLYQTKVKMNDQHYGGTRWVPFPRCTKAELLFSQGAGCPTNRVTGETRPSFGSVRTSNKFTTSEDQRGVMSLFPRSGDDGPGAIIYDVELQRTSRAEDMRPYTGGAGPVDGVEDMAADANVFYASDTRRGREQSWEMTRPAGAVSVGASGDMDVPSMYGQPKTATDYALEPDSHRISSWEARYVQKQDDEMISSYTLRPPVPNAEVDGPMWTEWVKTDSRRVQPDIQCEIDVSLRAPLMSNPYALPITV